MSSRTLAQVSSLGRSVGAMALCGGVMAWALVTAALMKVAPWWPALLGVALIFALGRN